MPKLRTDPKYIKALLQNTCPYSQNISISSVRFFGTCHFFIWLIMFGHKVSNYLFQNEALLYGLSMLEASYIFQTKYKDIWGEIILT